MVLNLSKANKQQLITLALYENISMGLKYEVCREIQMRYNRKMLPDIVLMYGRGQSAEEIAEYLGINVESVGGIISYYGLKRAKVV